MSTYVELYSQLTTALVLTFQLTNYVPDYPIGRDYGLLIQSDEVITVVSSNLDLHVFKLSTVSSSFDLWSLSDILSRTYPDLSKPYLADIDKLHDSNYLQSLIRDSIT